MCRKVVYLTVFMVVLCLLGTASADLVGLWKLDDGSGTVAVDRTGNGHNGELIGGPEWVDGLYGGALHFAGAGSKVDVPQSEQLNPTDAFSATLWVNVDAGSSGYRSPITSRDDGPARGYIIYAHNSGYWSYWTGTGSGWNQVNGPTVVAEEWTHLAITFDEGAKKLYIDGELVGEGNAAISPNTDQVLRIGAGQSETDGNYWFVGTIDDVAIFDHALTDGEVLDAMSGVVGPEYARRPSPSNGATDVAPDAALSWESGKFAASHDVYLGTSYDDVNDAGRNDPMDVLVSQGQGATVYQPDTVLDFEQTYYWRVDEVNGAPDNTVFQGGIWSFTVEPFAYTVADVNATSNTTSVEGQGPDRLVDGSGLIDGQHSTVPGDMWLGTPDGTEAPYVQFEFDRVYKMHEMLVWNYNMAFELALGFGVKDATVEYSVDGADWTVLGDVELAQATSMNTYTYNNIVPLEGIAAKYVRLMIGSSFISTASHGLSEVRFTYIPAQAREPQPADGETGVLLDTPLSWRAGRDVITHEVYLGTDPNVLELAGTPAGAGFDAALELDTTYYWQVDETDADGTWKGALWSFATQEYIVIDDFDDYVDDESEGGQAVWSAWIDGLVEFGGDAENGGSQVGHNTSPFAEQTIVHTGSQSMPLYFSNTSASAISEADYAFDTPQDWTVNGIKSLSLWFYGTAGNTGTLYVSIDGTKVTYDGDASDIATGIWQVWNIDLTTVGANLSSVTELSIGVEGAGEGVIYIDDVRLYGQTPQVAVPTEPSDENLVSYYPLDGNFNDTVGGRNGVAAGDPEFISDATRGQVAAFNGATDMADVEYSPELNPETFTVSVWAYPDPAGLSYRSPITSRDDGPTRGYILYITPDDNWAFWTGQGTGWNGTGNAAATLGEWVHVAGTYDGQMKALYINGRLAAQNEATVTLNEAQPLRIGAGASEGPGSFFWHGMLDDIRLYNTALTPGEVAGLAGRTGSLYLPF